MKIGILSTRDADSTRYEHQEQQVKVGKIFEKSVVARRILLFISILGMCMLIGDGILTPAISGLAECFISHYCYIGLFIHLYISYTS